MLLTGLTDVVADLRAFADRLEAEHQVARDAEQAA
jgi:hypothetical protein